MNTEEKLALAQRLVYEVANELSENAAHGDRDNMSRDAQSIDQDIQTIINELQ